MDTVVGCGISEKIFKKLALECELIRKSFWGSLKSNNHVLHIFSMFCFSNSKVIMEYTSSSHSHEADCIHTV